MRIIQYKSIRFLIIINLTFLAIILSGKIYFIHRLMVTTSKAFLIPLFISVLIFYIIRPLNNIFIKKGIGHGKASMLTLSICVFILSGLLSYFSKYAYAQFEQINQMLKGIIADRKRIDGLITWINQFINVNEIYALAAGSVKNYIQQIAQSSIRVVGYFMNTFSMVFLIIIIVFYLLKDSHKFKDKVLAVIPERYRKTSDELMTESDIILMHYVTGQAKVALSLAVMIFIGYKIIGMPNVMVLSTITFILAFIPFVGFFISMIIPVVIAVSMGCMMFFKLLGVFVIVQTLKGRVVVPAIMAKSMNIHPLTDIFLVIGAIAIGGPFAAFAVVPIYAIIKKWIYIIKSTSSM